MNKKLQYKLTFLDEDISESVKEDMYFPIKNFFKFIGLYEVKEIDKRLEIIKDENFTYEKYPFFKFVRVLKMGESFENSDFEEIYFENKRNIIEKFSEIPINTMVVNVREKSEVLLKLNEVSGKVLIEIEDEKTKFEKWLLYTKMIEPDDLIYFMNDIILKEFFNTSSSGKIIFLKQNHLFSFNTRSLKYGLIIENFGIEYSQKYAQEQLFIGKNFFYGSSIKNIGDLLLNILNLLFFPKLSSFKIETMYGYIFLFLPEVPIDLNFKEDNELIMSMMEVKNDKLEHKIKDIPSIDENLKIILYILEKINKFIFIFFDFENFTRNKNELSLSDMYNFYLSIEKLLNKYIQLFSTNNSEIKLDIIFEIADIYDGIAAKGNKNKTALLFKKLFNGDILKSIKYIGNDKIMEKYFYSEYEEIYNNFNDKIFNSIWREENKETNDSVKLFEKNSKGYKEKIKTKEEYVSSYIRSIRNTHHGYMDMSKSQNIFINTGNIPDEILEMPMMWFLLMLEDPIEFLGIDK